MLGLGAVLINQQVIADPVNRASPLLIYNAPILSSAKITQEGSYWISDGLPSVFGVEYDLTNSIPGVVDGDISMIQGDVCANTGYGHGPIHWHPGNEVTIAGEIYSKITNTSSDFLNQHGYIRFIVEGGEGSGGYLTRPNHSFGWQGPCDSMIGVDSHVKVNGKITDVFLAFDEKPTAVEFADLILVYVPMSFFLKDGSTVYSHSAHIGVKLAIMPADTKTCDVSNQTVDLPSLRADDIKAGVAAGATRFNVTATCDVPSSNVNTHFTLVDNSLPDGVDHDVIYFSGDNAKRGGIEVRDTNGTLIKTGTENVFGDLTAGQATVSKTLVAGYKFNTDSPPSGQYGAQATILVSYK